MAWPRSPRVYEINTRVWLKELQARLATPVTLANVPVEEIRQIADLGFDAIWLMGVWRIGQEAVNVSRSRAELRHEYQKVLPNFQVTDIQGSPYAVASYEVARELGGPAGLAALRARMAEHGLLLILDFVGNHTAKDHWLVAARPEIYISGSPADMARDPESFYRTPQGTILAHGRDPYFPAWPDTAQLNYGNATTRVTMRSKLESIADQCDGVRCDMAMLMLPDVMERTWGERLGRDWVRESFWLENIPYILDAHPDFLFVAEAYWGLERRLQDEGFHYTYDKALYDHLVRGDLGAVRHHLAQDPSFQEGCVRFVENHDEARAAATFGGRRAQAAAAVALFSRGMRLLHDGQLEGRRFKLPVQLVRRPPEHEDLETRRFYEIVLRILASPVFSDGDYRLCETHPVAPWDHSWEGLIGQRWMSRDGEDLGWLIVTNLAGERSQGRIPVPDLDAAAEYVFEDHWDGARYRRQGGEVAGPGLYVALDGHRIHLFRVSLA